MTESVCHSDSGAVTTRHSLWKVPDKANLYNFGSIAIKVAWPMVLNASQLIRTTIDVVESR
jgi:hypothetical protein